MKNITGLRFGPRVSISSFRPLIPQLRAEKLLISFSFLSVSSFSSETFTFPSSDSSPLRPQDSAAVNPLIELKDEFLSAPSTALALFVQGLLIKLQ